MRSLAFAVVPLAFVVATAAPALAAPLVVDGTNSPLTIASAQTVDSLTVASGGTLIVNATLTVTGDAVVQAGGTVTHDAKNAGMRLIVGGNLTVTAGGVIDANAKGHGSGSGTSAFGASGETIDPITLQVSAGAPGGQGGSHGGRGAGGGAPNIRGNQLGPVTLGDGGGGGTCSSDGGRGGGKLQIEAGGAVRIDGIVRADGESAPGGGCGAGGGGGAGGSVWIIGQTFEGAGVLTVRGGNGNLGAGGGRIKVEFGTRTFTGTISAAAGNGAGTGTSYLVQPSGALFAEGGNVVLDASATHPSVTLLVAGGLQLTGSANVTAPVTVPAGTTLTIDASDALDDVTINGTVAGNIRVLDPVTFPSTLSVGGVLTLDALLTVQGDLSLESGSLLTHSANLDDAALNVSGTFHVKNGSNVDLSGRGIPAGLRFDPLTQTLVGTPGFEAGSHGGLGGGGNPGVVYDDTRLPTQLGSGGGGGTCGSVGGAGGGLVSILAGTLRVDGVFRADGFDAAGGGCGNAGGGGAGGTIRAEVTTFSGTGVITADGGGGLSGGGGGRIALYYTTKTFTGTLSARTSPSTFNADDGTVHMEDGAGALTVVGGRLPITAGDAFPSVTLQATGTLEVNGNAIISAPVVVTAGSTVELNDASSLATLTLNPAIAGTLTINAPITLPAATTINGAMIVNDALTVNGNLTVPSLGFVTHDARQRDASIDVIGTFDVRAGGRVDANGKGLQAGSSAGNPFGASGAALDPATFLIVSGAGAQNGAGHGGAGGGGAANPVYGDPDFPDHIGSGGGGGTCGSVGGTGGGRLVLSATTLIVGGAISANGTAAAGGGCGAGGGGGSGGTVRITATNFQGAGTVFADGAGGGNGGGGGRIRVDVENNTFTGVLRAASGGGSAGAGTINVVDADADTLAVSGGVYEVSGADFFSSITIGAAGVLIVDGPVAVATTVQVPAGATLILASSDALDNMEVDPSIGGTVIVDAPVVLAEDVVLTGRLVVNDRLVVPSLEARVGSIITHDQSVETMDLVVTGVLDLKLGARIDAVGKGFLPAPFAGFGNQGATSDPVTLLVAAGSNSQSGGSHVARGAGGTPAAAYDNATAPTHGGGGGGIGTCGSAGGAGGGMLRVSAGAFIHSGVVAADGNGAPGGGCGNSGGGGAGGAVILSVGSWSGAGSFTVRGGNASVGGGAGGVVVVTYGSSTYSGVISVAAGSGGAAEAGQSSEATQTDVPEIVSSPILDAEVGRLFRYRALALGSPVISWTLVDGAPGASLDALTGELLWTPTQAFAESFTIRAVNAIGFDEQTFVLVPGAAPTITSVAAAGGQVGTAYLYDADAAASAVGSTPLTWSAPTAPSGFAIDAATGAIAWTPDASGTFPACIQASNNFGDAVQCFAVVVAPPVGAAPPVITSVANDAGFLGVPYDYDADNTASADGDQPITWSTLLAPLGFTVDATTGVVSWTPDEAGPVGVCLLAVNVAGEDTQCFTVDVGVAGPPIFTSVPITLATQGIPYAYDADGTVSVTGAGPLVLTAPTAPAGFTIDADTGFVTWTPLQPGDTEVLLRAQNPFGTTEQSFIVAVLPSLAGSAPVIERSANAFAAVDLPYPYDEDGAARAGGDPPIAWSLVNGPSDFHIDADTGVVTWVPKVAGVETVTIRATNNIGSGDYTFTVDVAADAGPEPTPVAIIVPTAGDAPLALTADGSQSFAPPGRDIAFYRWTWGDGAAPDNGALASHVYQSPGSYVARLRITDAVGATGEVSTVIRVANDGVVPPAARILVSQLDGSDELEVSVSCACEDGDAPIEAYLWDFGDGTQSDLPAATHVFGPGGFEVRLTVVDGNGLTASDALSIRVSDGDNQPPLVLASADPVQGPVPFETRFDASYGDVDGSVVDVAWAFGEGSTSGETSPQFTYAVPGPYLATVTVTDDRGLASTASVAMDVLNEDGVRPPQILSLPILEARAGEAYRYDDNGVPAARGDRPLTWSLGKSVGGTIVGVPPGMTIDAGSGALTWTPPKELVGAAARVPVTLVVQNAAGAVAQDWEIEVLGGVALDEPLPPEGCGCAADGGGAEATAGALAFLGVIHVMRDRRKRRFAR